MNNDNSNQRRAIWDMNAEDTTLYLVLFISLMTMGAAYALWFRFAYEQVEIAKQVMVAWKDVGLAGGTAAAMGFAIIVVRRGIMALIDWPSKDKYRAEGRAEGHVEGLAEGRAEGHAEGLAEGLTEGMDIGAMRIQNKWLRWNNLRLEAELRGERFNEPPPSP